MLNSLEHKIVALMSTIKRGDITPKETNIGKLFKISKTIIKI